jgi:hypothetical protein
MKTKKIIGLVAVTAIVATSVALAQDANVSGGANINANADIQVGGNPGGPGHPPRPGILNQLFGSFKDDRREVRQEFGDERKELREEFKENMKERREWMMGSTTPGMATPTPWKNYREGMKDMREEMRGKMASLTEAQMASITAKLGITVQELKVKLASGTPLREIIGEKISREDMMRIMPPMMASGTMGTNTRPHFDGRRPQGFINSIRNMIFGGENELGVEANASATAQVNGNGLGAFLRRIFNF